MAFSGNEDLLEISLNVTGLKYYGALGTTMNTMYLVSNNRNKRTFEISF